MVKVLECEVKKHCQEKHGSTSVMMRIYYVDPTSISNLDPNVTGKGTRVVRVNFGKGSRMLVMGTRILDWETLSRQTWSHFGYDAHILCRSDLYFKFGS